MPAKVKSILILAGVLIGLACTELLLAFFYPQPNFYFFEYAPGGYIFHKPNLDTLIAEVPKKTRLVPFGNSAAGIDTIRQYIMPLRTNNAGFRSVRSTTYEKVPKQYRILHLGDSLGFGFPLMQEESYAQQVENLVPHTEVLNASTVFTHTARLLQYYQKEGYKYDPDMVILQLTISSPREDYLALDALGKSRFELGVLEDSGERDAIEPFITKDEAGIDQLSWTYSERTKEFFEAVHKKFDAATFFYRYFNIARLFTSTSDVLKTPVQTLAQGYYMRMGPLTKSYQKMPESASRAFNAQPALPLIDRYAAINRMDTRFTRTYLEVFKKTLAAEHKELIVIVIPNRNGCQGLTYPAWEKLFGELLDSEYHVINFYPDFCDGDTKKPREQYFLPEEFHLNAAGHRVIAERLAQEVAALKDAHE